MTRWILELTGLLYSAGVAAVIAAGNTLARTVETNLPVAATAVDLIAAMGPYDQFVNVATMALALYLGIWSASVGLYTGQFLLGFSLLGLGVAGTAVAFAFLSPEQLNGVGYPATAVWLFGNVYIYFGAWLATGVAGVLRTSVPSQAKGQVPTSLR